MPVFYEVDGSNRNGKSASQEASTIDPITAGILTGLLVEGIKEVIRIGPQSPKVPTDEGYLEYALNHDASFSTILTESIEYVVSRELPVNESQTEFLRSFLGSPEVEAIVRQIFASRLVEEANGSLNSVRREFEALVALRFGEDDLGYENLATGLFETLLAGCDRGLEIAIDKGALAAHEARSSFRYRVLRDELATIQKNIDFLTQDRKPDIENILRFEQQYRHQMASRYDSLTPPYVDTLRRVPIDELYVAPSFTGPPSEKGEEAKQLKTPELLSTVYRAVVLGNPGSGKSTFAQKLCHDLSARYSSRLFAGRQLTPILVILRDYGAEKRENDLSILQFIEKKASSDYQVEAPHDAFKYLLLNGRTIVIFDGLDELLDTSRRQEVSRAVESFCTLYPSVPVLVTSRVVGYEQAPLDGRKFETFRLSDFDEEQVREYATKWFAANTDLNLEQQRRQAETFLVDSQIVPDLRANPLMLGLMCNIYRGENYIPRNRPDVYKKCAEMLFERWDRSRGIHYSLPFDAHVRPAMTYLAHWIYSDEALQGGVTEDQLIEKATDYLHPEQFEDRETASLAARQFVEFCRGRAWVFTDIGTTPRGERLYQFTHRTFLEYFTANYLTRTHYTPDRLIAVLLPRIRQREWNTVAQLAFQIQSETAAGADDELIATLIEQANRGREEESWNYLAFAAQCLEFMVPSTTVRAEVTTVCLQRCITWAAHVISQSQVQALTGLRNNSVQSEVSESYKRWLRESRYCDQ